MYDRVSTVCILCSVFAHDCKAGYDRVERMGFSGIHSGQGRYTSVGLAEWVRRGGMAWRYVYLLRAGF